MNLLDSIEITADSLEAGSPVHDAVYNIVSTVRQNQRNTDPHTIALVLDKVGKVVARFTSMDIEDQWAHEDTVSHGLMSLCATL